MKLMDVKIRGFRSIEYMEILLGGEGHKVLVGKNESGKSNILKALRLLLDGTFKKSEEKLMFAENQPASVIFRFELEQDELVECRDSFIKKFIRSDVNLTNRHSVEEFYNEHAEILYRFDIDKQGEWCWGNPDNIQINDGWYYLRDKLQSFQIPADSYIPDSFIQTLSDDEQEEFRLYLSIVGTKDIYYEMHNAIKETLKLQNMPFPCVYWEYNSQKHDIPHSINIEKFSQNPDVCLPLQQMFLLAGYQRNDIQKAISDTRRSPNHVQSLLKKISRDTQNHINENWKEYNKEYINVKIDLQKDGDNIRIGIQDFENLYDFAQRSDGFRRFVSFLLLMAGKENSLILLDEPETGLHPSGAKDLRDLLIKLGKQNIIVYATHSISMVDTENVENNLIIYKEDENTRIKAKKEDGISPGELVYEAIGYSIYNELKKKNILLEGYTDRKILKSFMQGGKWKEFGLCYTDGVTNINYVVSLLELGNRESFVLSDADKATEQSRENANIEHWYTYEDLGSDAITLEDFYTKNLLYDITKSILEEKKIQIQESLFNDMPNNGKLKFIKENLYKMQSMDKKTMTKILKDIKLKCAKQATEKDIDMVELESVLNKFLEKITAKKP